MPDPDTIVALGTPPGTSAVGVVRLSGPGAWSIVSVLCPALEGPPEARKATLAVVRDPTTGERLDQVLLTHFPGPGSYTGEDMAEISCHGGWVTPPLVLEACIAAGARLAEEGEFTRQAYLNGKMDLVQVEAVLDLIEGRTRAIHDAALRQLERGLSNRIGALREGIIGLEALLVHHLDFPEEDEPPVPTEEIARKARELEAAMTLLLETAPEGELLREGAVTVLAGRPNSGKSSLFNALLGVERAIVTETPGTTRDALEAVVSLGGFPFRLVDTAGLRDTEEEVERLGIEVARRYLEEADLILFCAEAGRELGDAEEEFIRQMEGVPMVLVRTMMDRVDGGGMGNSSAGCRGDEGGPCVGVSVRTGEGLGVLKEVLPELVFSGLVGIRGEVPLLTRRRHAHGVRRAWEEVQAFRQALENGVPAEAAATHLRPAETALEEVLGVIPREEILDRVFREFCIGK